MTAGTVPGSGQQGSARKLELLDAAYRYVLANGLADMSLRPLAKAIGSSPRVLLFLFGSKDGLIRAVLARARVDELGYLEALRSQRAPRGEGEAGLATTGAEAWSSIPPTETPSFSLRAGMKSAARGARLNCEGAWFAQAARLV